MTPKFRQSLYYLGTLVSAALGISMVWGGIGPDAAHNIEQVIAGLVALLGSAAPAVAASTVSKQRKDGTLEPVAPADQVIQGVQAVIQARATAQSDLDKVRDAVSEIAAHVPVLGPLASQALNQIRF